MKVISWRVRQLLFVLMAAFVAYVEGPTNPYWVWNCMPVAVSYLFLRKVRGSNVSPLPEIAFFVVACGVVLVAHAAWLESPPGTSGGTSIPGPTLALLPIYAAVLGGAAFGIAVFFNRRAGD